MLIRLTFIIYLLCFVVQSTNAQQLFEWARAISGDGAINTYSIAVDSKVNVLSTGWISSTIDFDPGSSVFNLTSTGGDDIFITKIDSTGSFVWAKTVGGPNVNQKGNSIAVDSHDNIFIIGHFIGTIDFDPGPSIYNLTASGISGFAMKLNSQGDFLWAKSFGNYAAYSAAIDKSDNIAITGMFSDLQDFDPGPGTTNLLSTNNSVDGYILKLDGQGQFVWAKQIGGSKTDKSYGICVDKNGNYLITGTLNELCYPLDPLYSGNCLVTPNDYNDSIFISKFNTSGNLQWTKYFVGDSTNVGQAITSDLQGNIYSTGRFWGNVDFDPGPAVYNLQALNEGDGYVVKLDINGNFLWAKNFHTQSTSFYLNSGIGIVTDFFGNAYITGHFGDAVDFNPGPNSNIIMSAGNRDIFLSSLTSDGAYLGTSTFGNSSFDMGTSLSIDRKNNLYLGGVFSNTVDFDESPNIVNLTAPASGAAFVLKMFSLKSPLSPLTSSDCDVYSSIKIYWASALKSLVIDKQKSDCEITLSIFNISGQALMRNVKLVDGSQEFEMHYAKGIYVYLLRTTTGESRTGKFILL
jgi:hypothetical protein